MLGAGQLRRRSSGRRSGRRRTIDTGIQRQPNAGTLLIRLPRSMPPSHDAISTRQPFPRRIRTRRSVQLRNRAVARPDQGATWPHAPRLSAFEADAANRSTAPRRPAIAGRNHDCAPLSGRSRRPSREAQATEPGGSGGRVGRPRRQSREALAAEPGGPGGRAAAGVTAQARHATAGPSRFLV